MVDAPLPTPIADKALLRLRALAQGNGLDPAKIVLTASEEKIYSFEGLATLAPLFETRTERYDGPPRGKVSDTLPSFAALRDEAKKRETGFRNNPDWITAAAAELRKQPAEGWGLNGARIELPECSLTLAASESCATCQGRANMPCAQCQGRGYDTCIQCRGNRQEFCYYCNFNNTGTGTGSSQLTDGRICPVCNGLRRTPCRACHGAGQTSCPQCQTRGQIACTTCKGAGQTTEIVHITCGATTSFGLKSEDLPSGLRRGLDRLGIANLAKGHAEISFVENKAEKEPEEPEEYLPGGLYGVAPGARAATLHEENPDPGFGAPKADTSRSPQPVLHYTARMPFADLRVDFSGRKAAVGVFGLRNAFVDVPPFLDDFLTPALGKLIGAIKGYGSIEDALATRALREAVELHLQSKGKVQEFRRLYPVGVSNAVVENILRGTRNSIKRLTLPARVTAATVSALAAAGIFATCYFTSLPQRLLSGPTWNGLALDFLPPVVAAALGLIVVNFTAYFDVHRHFPGAKIHLRQGVGKTGYALLAVIVIVWLALLAFSPARPLWLHLPVL